MRSEGFCIQGTASQDTVSPVHALSRQSEKRESTRREESHLSQSPPDSILVLPDDLLFMIIEKLTTDERIRFGVTCKRIRQLDRVIGRRSFENVRVNCVSIICTSSICSMPIIFSERFLSECRIWNTHHDMYPLWKIDAESRPSISKSKYGNSTNYCMCLFVSHIQSSKYEPSFRKNSRHSTPTENNCSRAANVKLNFFWDYSSHSECCWTVEIRIDSFRNIFISICSSITVQRENWNQCLCSP